MTDLFILHDTEKIYIQKVFYTIVQSYFFSSFCDIWQPLSNWNGYNSKSIELRNLSKVIASCYRRLLQKKQDQITGFRETFDAKIAFWQQLYGPWQVVRIPAQVVPNLLKCWSNIKKRSIIVRRQVIPIAVCDNQWGLKSYD